MGEVAFGGRGGVRYMVYGIRDIGYRMLGAEANTNRKTDRKTERPELYFDTIHWIFISKVRGRKRGGTMKETWTGLFVIYILLMNV